VPVACAFRQREGKRLLVTLPDGAVRVPLSTERFTIRLEEVERSPLLLRFAVEGQPQREGALKVYVPFAR
ncbi:MAG: hypothetical protein NZ741_13025, partial [Armatimonadetes bacterium]|nr:hypothetical protein [Armatimonadota bacterium]